MNSPTYDIAIVGCGPVGALLANLLAPYGLRIVVLERETSAYSLPRAAHLDDEALRILNGAGVLNEALVEKRVIDGLDIVSKSGKVLVRARKERAAEQPFGFPAATLVHQPTVERALRLGLSRYPNIKVKLGCSVETLQEDEGVVRITSSGTDGPTSFSANWAVGCDGANSLVREAMGSRMKGGRLEQPWLVVDVLLKRDISLSERLLQIADPKRPTTYVPFADPRRRWEFMLKRGEAPESIARPESIRSLLAAHIDPDAVEIERAAVYTFRQSTAIGWRKGRLLIAGDAAHQMPPFLGQGLCSGLRDVNNLAWKLALVAKGAADPALLETYEVERRPHVEAITKLAVRVGRLIQASGPLAGLRDIALRLLHGFRPAHQKLLNMEGTIPPLLSAFAGPGAPALTLLPQPTVETSDGQHLLLDGLLGNGFALIGLGVSPGAWVEATEFPTWQALIARSVYVVPDGNAWPEVSEGEVAVRDPSDALRTWAGVEEGVVVVRPDRHAFGVYGRTDWRMAASAVREALGLR